jgi:hypothetical protein
LHRTTHSLTDHFSIGKAQVGKKNVPAWVKAVQGVVRGTLFSTADVFGKLYGHSVRPILLERNEAAELVGSGILFQAGQRHFVLTAGHVAAEGVNGTLLIGSASETWHLPPFKRTIAGEDGKDPYDLAFAELPGDLAQEFTGCRFLRPEDTDVDDRIAAGRFYTFLGFPHRAQNLDYTGNRFSPTGTVFTGLELSEKDYARVSVPAPSQITASPDIHVAVSFDSTKVMSPAGKRAIGHQHGISGGGLWRRDDLAGQGSYKLVGVVLGAQTSGTRAACATRIAVMFELLRAAYPDVDDALPRSQVLRTQVHRGTAP